MLGESIGQCTGRVTGVRVLSTDGPHVRLEMSLQGQGALLGQPITDFGTYVQTVRPGGVLQGEAHNVMLTASGEAADWLGGGVGRPTGPGFKSTYGAYGRFELRARCPCAARDGRHGNRVRGGGGRQLPLADVGVERREPSRGGGDGVAPGAPTPAAAPAAPSGRPPARTAGRPRGHPEIQPRGARHDPVHPAYIRYALSCLSAVAFKLASN